MNNSQVLLKLFDHWFRSQAVYAEEESQQKIQTSSYVPATKATAGEKICMTTKSSLQKCMDIAADHARICGDQLSIGGLIRKGHVAMTRLRCKSNHATSWSSSPYLPNGQYLINYRVFHGYSCSGQLPTHYQRMCEGAKHRNHWLEKQRHNAKKVGFLLYFIFYIMVVLNCLDA